MPTTDFSLIRHGETEANIKGILQGHTNTQLDETGICQAQCAAKRLIGEKFDLIFASDLDRALHTARIIVDQIGGEIIPTPKLREWHLGELENRPTKELWETYPQIMECFRTQQTEDIAVPGGESFFEFNKNATPQGRPKAVLRCYCLSEVFPDQSSTTPFCKMIFA